MTAGQGIVHSERGVHPPRAKQLEGIQTWVALPIEHEETNPEFFHYEASEIPGMNEGNVHLKVIAGKFQGLHSPVKIYSDLLYADLQMEPGEFSFTEKSRQIGLYLSKGSAQVGSEKMVVGDLAVFEEGEPVKIEALESSRFVLFGGERFPEKRLLYWNFVASSQEKITKAKIDWKEGRFPKVPGETDFIPLPAE